MTVLEWTEGQTHQAFIGQMSPPDQPYWQAQMILDAVFIKAFLNLSPEHAQELTRAIATAPVFMITLKGIPTIARRKTTQRRFRQLCGMLGSIRHVQTLHVNSEDNVFSTNHAKIVGSLKQVKNLSIWGRTTHRTAMRALATGLECHPTLESLRLAIPVTYYPLVLPAAYTICSLNKLVLHKHVALAAEIVPAAAHAMAGLLHMGETNPGLRIEFEHWDFSNVTSHNIFCEALAETTIRGVEVVGCCFTSPTLLASALTQSKLREIKFSLLRFPGHSLMNFLIHLSTTISNMAPYLEELECGQFDSRGEFGSYDEAVVQLTHAVAQCHCLRSLALNFHKYPQHADAALAKCLSPDHNRLVELNVRCISLKSESEPRVTESPALLQVLKDNYTIRRIRFHSAAPFGRFGQPSIDPWDPFLKKNIEMFAKLNCAGRSYVTRDSMDKARASCFMGAISDDLDLVFYHLSRENPSLCDRHTGYAGMGQAGGRKRRRDGLSDMLDHLSSFGMLMYNGR